MAVTWTSALPCTSHFYSSSVITHPSRNESMQSSFLQPLHSDLCFRPWRHLRLRFHFCFLLRYWLPCRHHRLPPSGHRYKQVNLLGTDCDWVALRKSENCNLNNSHQSQVRVCHHRDTSTWLEHLTYLLYWESVWLSWATFFIMDDTMPLYCTLNPPELSIGSPYWSTIRTPFTPCPPALNKRMRSACVSSPHELNLHLFYFLLNFVFDWVSIRRHLIRLVVCCR